MGCACDTRPVGWRWERRGKDNEDWLMAEGEASSSSQEVSKTSAFLIQWH